ncbi:hypothetical protein AAG570_003989 [Ranatra chinensis]|uniref:Major facilitator superfamily (MFS) profile domain-containing protein n=1 Tax=Ranatra chinensis TaxID=642074 RepID=A0ABD0YP99_9HEMI
MLIFGVSAICTMPTIVIGALYKTNNTEIVLSEQEASWFGSIVYIVQPLGSVTSGFIQDTFGRRRCMMGVTVPQFIGWIILYFSGSVGHLYTAAVIMGLSIGFMEAPAMSYLGEVTEPRYRGTLSTFSEVFLLLGILFEFFVGAVLYWRYACAVSILIPVAVFIAVYLIPESPTWLIVKGRITEAHDSLRWLRGWVTHEEVQDEFNTLMETIKMSPLSKLTRYLLCPVRSDSHKIYHFFSGPIRKPKRRKGLAKLVLLKEARIYRPMLLVAIFFFVGHCTSLLGLRPFLVKIFGDLNLPIDPYWALVLSGSVQAAGSIVGAATIHSVGKRKLAFYNLVGSFICCFLLGAYILSGADAPWAPLTLFCILFFCTGCGVMPLPWVLICEIFPLDGRGIAAGLTAASSYIFSFLITKTFIDLVSVLELSGVVILYGAIGVAGFVFLYFRLPETEGKTLAEIELFFNKDKRPRPQFQV